MTTFTLTPELKITIDEIADGVSNAEISEIMELIKTIDNYVQDWDFPVALFKLASEMVSDEEFIHDLVYLDKKGENEVEKAMFSLQKAIAQARRQKKTQ